MHTDHPEPAAHAGSLASPAARPPERRTALDSALYRASAWCLVGSFAASLAGGLAHPVVDGQAHSVDSFLAPASPWAQLLIYLGALLLMLGLPGGYLWFRDRLGVLGLIGFGGYFLGNALSAMSHLVVEGFVGPVLAADPGARHLVTGNIVEAPGFIALQAVGGLLFVASLVVIAVALGRIAEVPRWVRWLLLVGALLLLTPVPERPVLSGVLVELPRGVMVAALGVTMLRQLAAGRPTKPLSS